MAQEFWPLARQPAERAAFICSGSSEAHIRSDLQRTSNAASGQKNQSELLKLLFRDALVRSGINNVTYFCCVFEWNPQIERMFDRIRHAKT